MSNDVNKFEMRHVIWTYIAFLRIIMVSDKECGSLTMSYGGVRGKGSAIGRVYRVEDSTTGEKHRSEQTWVFKALMEVCDNLISALTLLANQLTGYRSWRL